MHFKIRVALLWLFVASPLLDQALFAQPLKPGEWRTYTSMRSIRGLAVASDSIHLWAATGGGIFRINLRDSEEIIALRTTDGLTENDISSIAEDADGNTYVGGKGGAFDIVRGNGTIEKHGSDIRSKQELTVKTINGITLNGDTVFLATAYGLEVYRKRERYFATTVFQLGTQVSREDSVREVCLFHGFIFAAVRQGLAYASLRTDISIPSNWSLIQDTNIGAVHALTAFRDQLCVGTSKGLFTFSESAKTLSPTPFQSGVDRLSANSNALYVLGLGHDIRSTSDLSTFSDALLPQGMASAISSIVAASAVGLVLGTQESGVAYLLGSQGKTNIYPPGPVSNDTKDLDYSAFKDQLFFVNGPSGFGSFSPATSAWTNYSNGTVLPYNSSFQYVRYDSVRDLTWLIPPGRIYAVHQFGTTSMVIDSVKRIESGLPATTTDLTDEFIPAGKPIVCANGQLAIPNWARDGSGLSILDAGSQYHFRNYKLIDAYAAWGCLTQDLEGNFWAGGQYNQSYPPDAGVSWHRMTDHTYGNIAGPPGPLLSNAVNAVLTDQDDEIWCGTSSGLQILSNPYAISDKSPKFYLRSVKLLERQIVRCMAIDGVGNKWIGTEEGIFVVSPDGSDSVARFTKDNSPLIDNSISAIAIDVARGEAYASTPAGISRFSTIFKQGQSDYSKIRAFPNPAVQTTEESPVVYIDGLMAGSTVKIFALNMSLIKTINGENLGSTVVWNGRDDSGHQVASGEYLISATTTQSGEHGTAKVVIVRK